MKLPFPRFDAELVHSIEDHLDMAFDTEIVGSTPGNEEGLVNFQTRGRYEAGRSQYVRPMFQVLSLTQHGFPTRIDLPCAVCYDFSRTADCADHPDQGIPYQLKAKPAPGRYTQPAVGSGAAAWLREEILAETTARRDRYIAMVTADGALSWRVSGS